MCRFVNVSAVHIFVFVRDFSSMFIIMVKVRKLFVLDIFTSEEARKCLSEPHISEQLEAACRKVAKKRFHFHGSQDPDAKAL